MEKPSCNIPLIWMNYSDCTVTSLESWLVRESSPSGLMSIYFRWITIMCPDSCQWISHIVIRCHKSNGYEKNRSPAIVGGQPRTATRLWPRQGPCWSQRWTSHRSSGWRRVKDGGSPTVTKKRLPNISKPSIIIYCYLFFYLLVSIFRGRHLWDWTLMSEYDWCKKIHEQWNPWGFKSWSPQNGVKDALGCHKWKIWTSEKVFWIGQLDVLRKIVVSCSSKPPEGCGFDQREVGTIGWIWMNGEYQPRKPALHCQCWPRCLAGMFFCMVLVGIPTYISGFAWKIGAASIPMDDYYPHQVVHSGGITLFSDTLLSKWMGDA